MIGFLFVVLSIGSVFDINLIFNEIIISNIICFILKLNNVVFKLSDWIIVLFSKLEIIIVLIIEIIKLIKEIINVFLEKIFKIFLLFVLMVCNMFIFCFL